jgi:hypothetical protein
VLAFSGLLSQGVTPLLGQAPAAGSPEEQALRAASQGYLAALARSDRQAIAEFWVPGGIYIDQRGQAFSVKDLLAQHPDKPLPRAETRVTSARFRFLTADAAVEDGTSQFTPPGASAPIQGRFSAVWVRSAGRWKLDSLRESTSADETPAERMAALDPLVGEWTGQSGDLTMHIKAAWNADKTSLRREISILSHGKPAVQAVQQINWDPARRQVRSTTASDDGSHTDGIWSQEGNIWMVLARASHPNGSESRSTQIFKFVNRDTIVWKWIHASIDDRPAADLVITLARGDRPLPTRPSTPPVDSADEARKAQLLAGPSWKRVEEEFQKWAAVQVLYTPAQFEQMKARLIAEIKRLSAADLQQFIAELDAKLKLLLTKDAVEAQAWLGQYLSVMADGYRQKFVGQVPDFFNMTSEQIEDEYHRLQSKILSLQHAQAQFDISNAQVVKGTEATLAAARRAAARDANAVGSVGGSSSGGYQSHYSPKQSSHEYHPPQLNFFEWGGRIGFNLPL